MPGPSKEVEALRERLKDKKALTQKGSMDCKRNAMTQVTAGELRSACATNPSHSTAEVYLNAVGDGIRKEGREHISPLPDDYIVTVDSADLQALIENGTVEVDTTIENGGRVLQKRFVPAKESKARPPATTPAT